MFDLGTMVLQTLEDAKGIEEIEDEVAGVVFELGRAKGGFLDKRRAEKDNLLASSGFDAGNAQGKRKWNFLTGERWEAFPGGGGPAVAVSVPRASGK